ncbi:hypothetical protein PR202_gb27108 [Eleusine coracana subsp. coracana]|uniref:RING-type E3 ubiquitin transferase n=1 Tax=Eleusine coracana subsp. coracana TaxID=191504 RepID=A0AAV5FSY5_ELECO|nr:hypothetical protein PR202_gb27108 [Eleusine coracana subsp. coracana]
MSSNSSTTLPGAVAPSPCCCSARTLLDAAATIVAFRVLLAVFFLFLCFVLLRQRWRRNDARVVQEQPPPPMQQQKPKLGLDAAAIALLPSFPYRRAGADAECAVCLGDLDEGQTVRRLPGCGHVFHRECIDVWLASNASCPVRERRGVLFRGATGSMRRPDRDVGRRDGVVGCGGSREGPEHTTGSWKRRPGLIS